jgi:RIP homotypic interaction motif
VDPVTLILTALTAGAALGVKDTASQAVKDAYGSLKALVHRRLVGRRDGELVLARFEESPQAWEAPLAQELTVTRAGEDADLVAAAQALMALADAAGSQAGKYSVQIQGGQGVQLGDHNTQHNTFGAVPDR